MGKAWQTGARLPEPPSHLLLPLRLLQDVSCMGSCAPGPALSARMTHLRREPFEEGLACQGRRLRLDHGYTAPQGGLACSLGAEEMLLPQDDLLPHSPVTSGMSLATGLLKALTLPHWPHQRWKRRSGKRPSLELEPMWVNISSHISANSQNKSKISMRVLRQLKPTETSGVLGGRAEGRPCCWTGEGARRRVTESRASVVSPAQSWALNSLSY